MKSLKGKNKKGFFSNLSMPHAFTMLFFILVILGIVSLIFRYAGDGYYNSEGEWVPIIGAGILDWVQAIPAGFVAAIGVILFLFVLGGFINVIIKTQALEALIGKIATRFHADYKVLPVELKKKAPFTYFCKSVAEGFRQTWVIIPLMLFFSFAGTSYGMAEESLAFYAIIIPLALAAGFDLYTGFLIIFVGAGVGVMGSTINPFSVLTAVDAANKGGDKVITTAGDGAIWRWLGWLVFTTVTVVFVMWYAAKVKKDKNKSYLKDLFETHEKAFSSAAVGSVAPVLTKRRLISCFIFLSVFVFMVFAMLQYGSGSDDWGKKSLEDFNSNSFTDKKATIWFHNSKMSDKYNEMNSYDNVWAGWTFGQWYFGALISYFFIASLVIALINWKSERNYINEMVDGAKDMLGVAFAVGISRAISVLLAGTNMKEYFVSKISTTISESGGNKNITLPLFTYIMCIPLTFIIPSTSGLAGALFPILGPVVNNASPSAVSGTVTAYAWAAGLANMIVPTYGVVIGALALAKIPFGTFVRAIWKYLLMMFIIGLFMIVFGGLIGSSVF